MDVLLTREGDAYIIDMNARFGGGYPYSHMAGVDLPAACGCLGRKTAGQSGTFESQNGRTVLQGYPHGKNTGDKRMNTWKRLLLGSDRNIGQRNMIWNMVGSAVYSLTSMMLGIAVTRIVGPDMGRYFCLHLPLLGSRCLPYPILACGPFRSQMYRTNIPLEITGIFVSGQILAAILTGFFYMILFVDGTVKKAVVMLMVCYKVVDGFADVYESEFQRNGKLYLTGKSNTFRTLLSVGCFCW